MPFIIFLNFLLPTHDSKLRDKLPCSLCADLGPLSWGWRDLSWSCMEELNFWGLMGKNRTRTKGWRLCEGIDMAFTHLENMSHSPHSEECYSMLAYYCCRWLLSRAWLGPLAFCYAEITAQGFLGDGEQGKQKDFYMKRKRTEIPFEAKASLLY